jgi:translation initiation factor 2 subunit 3
MATMICGAALMNGALLLIAANEPCPQPQTKEHLMALDIIGIRNIVIVQNKVDLVSKEQAKKNFDEIRKFVKGSVAENAPIIPVAAHYGININALIGAIEETIKTPARDETKDFRMLVARSFDINRPGTEIESLKGGVIGGSILQGVVSEGDEIEICPGASAGGKFVPIRTRVASLSIKEGMIKTAKPGGLIGVGTLLDPSLTKSDNLIGSIAGKPGTLPPVRNELAMEVHLFDKVADLGNVEKLKMNEMIVINAGTATTVGAVVEIKKDSARAVLKKPVCAENGSKVSISRKSATRWCLIGYGVVK